MGKAFGKTILFGEHFVVYGLPAIVSAIDNTIQVDVKTSDKYTIIDKTIKFPGLPTITWAMTEKPVMRLLNHLKIDQPLTITIHGNLPIAHGGLGTSAAMLVALARALSNYFDLNLTDEEVNKAAFEGEKEFHGTPSGIDNTASTYGGTFWFEKREPQNIIKPIRIKKPIEIVLVESGVSTNTKKVVHDVKIFRENNYKKSEEIFENYKSLVIQARKALEEHDLKKVGLLMTENHNLLQKLTVSCEELDNITKLALDAGALGAKLTGTGRGGLAVILTPGKELQEEVANTLQKHGYAVLKTNIK